MIKIQKKPTKKILFNNCRIENSDRSVGIDYKNIFICISFGIRKTNTHTYTITKEIKTTASQHEIEMDNEENQPTHKRS